MRKLRVGQAILLAALAAVAIVPAEASASIAFHTTGSDTLNYDADLGEANQVVITHAGGVFTINDPGATITPGSNCERPPSGDIHVVTCPDSGVTRLDAQLQDLADTATIVATVPATLRGDSGADTLTGGSGGDTLEGAGEQDTLDGGAGADLLAGEEDVAVCNGVNGNTLVGGSGADHLRGGGGRDSMNGGEGVDTLEGCAGDDGIDGDAGDDNLIGDDGSDTLTGGAGNDKLGTPDLLGFPGRSRELGDDILSGGPGDDELFPGYGPGFMLTDADTLVGGEGLDRVSYERRTDAVAVSKDGAAGDGQPGENDAVAADVDVVAGGSGPDALAGSAGDDVFDGGPGDDRIVGLAGRDTLLGGPGDGGSDSIDGGEDADLLQGYGGEDTLSGGGGEDDSRGGTGNDELSGGAGNDELHGEEDNDRLEGGTGDDQFRGGGGTDEAEYPNGTAVSITLNGREGDGRAGERDNVGTDVEDVLGGSQQDTFIGAPRVPNRLSGGSGEDYVDGRAGPNDALGGGGGNDVLRGRDGIADSVRCGTGDYDFAIVDPRDRVRTTGREACERVDDGRRRAPAYARTALVGPVKGLVGMSPIRIRRFVPLGDLVNLPLRSRVDARAGEVSVRSARPRSATQRARFAAGVFQVLQSRRGKGLTDIVLKGGDFGKCRTGAATTSGGDAAASQRPRRIIRRLRGRARGRFRTRGRFSSATVRGTVFQVIDRCDGTLTRVERGIVEVRDFRQRKTITLRAGQSYLAKAAG